MGKSRHLGSSGTTDRRMISRHDHEIRIERDPLRVWIENLAGAGAALAFLVFALVAAHEPLHYLMVLAIAAGFSAVVLVSVRRHHVCIIGHDRIGFGDVNGPMEWIPRRQVASVRVRKTPFFQVSFYDTDGKLSGSNVFAFFSVREVREAFESAGIPVR